MLQKNNCETQIEENIKDIIKEIQKLSKKNEWIDTTPNKKFDITGKKLKNLHVIKFAYINRKTQTSYWICFCKKCERFKILSRNTIRKNKACGCQENKAAPKGMRHCCFKELTGKNFGYLTVLKLDSFCLKNKGSKWLCRCKCGNKTVVLRRNLISGSVKSCGCLRFQGIYKYKNKKIGCYTLIKIVGKLNQHGRNFPVWECKCNRCGKTRNLTHRYLRAKKNIGYCENCWSRKIMGRKHHNWNPKLTAEDRKQMRNRIGSKRYQKWRKGVWTRDSYVCQVTGGKSGGICAHHLDGWHWNKKARLDISNGVTILESVHYLFHHKYGFKNNTKSQFDEFVKNLMVNDKEKLMEINKKDKKEKLNLIKDKFSYFRNNKNI